MKALLAICLIWGLVCVSPTLASASPAAIDKAGAHVLAGGTEARAFLIHREGKVAIFAAPFHALLNPHGEIVSRIQLVSEGQNPLPATLIQSDPARNISVLRVDGARVSATPLQIRAGVQVKEGQVLRIPKVGLSEETFKITAIKAAWLVLDKRVPESSAGSPVVDEDGQLVGFLSGNELGGGMASCAHLTPWPICSKAM